MEDEPRSTPNYRSAVGRFGQAGILLLGVAAVIAAIAWAVSLHKEPTLESGGSLEPIEQVQQRGSEFRLVQLGEYRGDQFLLDQATGRVWRSICSGELTDGGAGCGGMVIWEEMYVQDVTPGDPPTSRALLTQLFQTADKVEEAAQ